jgi:hypothetical protein
MNSRRFIAMTQPKDHGQYSRSWPCIAAKAARSCPLWVISGHRALLALCPLYPRKRTSSDTTGMSA